MRIRMNQLAAGPDGTFEVGREYDVPDRTAAEMIRGRYADAVGPVPKHIQAQIKSGSPASSRETASGSAPERRGGGAANPPANPNPAKDGGNESKDKGGNA